MFTKTEKTILGAVAPEYKYIRRSPLGELLISESENAIYFKSMCEFNHIFKDVKPGDKPICFRNCLDDIERAYLKAVFKPFASRIKYVKKIGPWKGKEYIKVLMADPEGDNTWFPAFKAGTMYKGMAPNVTYTLEELGITYD